MIRTSDSISHTLLLVLAMVVLGFLPSTLHSFSNEPDGYDNIRWNADISTIKSMIHMKSKQAGPDDQELKFYTREGDVLEFGKAALKSIEYGFINDRFFSVTFKVADLFNYVMLKKVVFDKFGPGTEFDQFSERYYWNGESSRVTLVSAFDFS